VSRDNEYGLAERGRGWVVGILIWLWVDIGCWSS
jgi:hypothetical protein